ncbi:hypothetical protein ISF_07480 [Cordyceps fumosorosea ARSEF 2679]|uniref:Uncharacterized protein n=1 Tax=Cordyceps fumosorosea (strain ARSEF 2679) TaxID=1081104 RepID=A0A167P934_CORFA|nr:hypothetical protein ISF_07480 [Cordyceps fumosorosea ARSEF 2679]OAA56412.1 hypothetical protein ISF_07480 [Cordyceps fumosorosea ARSEF 2679]
MAYTAMTNAVNTDAVYPFYSPASVCPDGFVSACGYGRESTTPAPSVSSFAGYTCRNDKPYGCASVPQYGVTVYANGNSRCVSSDLDIWTATAWHSNTIVALAPALVLVADQDQTQTGATTTAATATSTTSNQSETTGGIAGGGGGGGGGLSTGAIAAIGASVPLAIIAAGLAVFAFLSRRSRRRASAEEAAAGTSTSGGGDSDPRHSVKTDFSSPAPDRALTVSPGTTVSAELYGSTTMQPRLHEDIMELPGEVSPPPAPRPISEAP